MYKLTVELKQKFNDTNYKKMSEEKNPQVTIYSTQFCGFCKLAKQYFDENNVSYTEVDVTSDEFKQEEMVKKSGQTGVPVIIINSDGQEEIIIGFQKEKLAQMLNIKN